MTLLVVGGNERMKRDYINLGKEKGYKTKVILTARSYWGALCNTF